MTICLLYFHSQHQQFSLFPVAYTIAFQSKLCYKLHLDDKNHRAFLPDLPLCYDCPVTVKFTEAYKHQVVALVVLDLKFLLNSPLDVCLQNSVSLAKIVN